jgi:hypothetical protein
MRLASAYLRNEFAFFPNISSFAGNRDRVIYLFAVKTRLFVLLACGIVVLAGCATSESFNAAETANTREVVPGEANPNAPEASQQSATKPGFNF